MFFDKETSRVLPLPLFSSKCQGIPFFQPGEIRHFCSGPIGFDPILSVAKQARRGSRRSCTGHSLCLVVFFVYMFCMFYVELFFGCYCFLNSKYFIDCVIHYLGQIIVEIQESSQTLRILISVLKRNAAISS